MCKAVCNHTECYVYTLDRITLTGLQVSTYTIKQNNNFLDIPRITLLKNNTGNIKCFHRQMLMLCIKNNFNNYNSHQQLRRTFTYNALLVKVV